MSRKDEVIQKEGKRSQRPASTDSSAKVKSRGEGWTVGSLGNRTQWTCILNQEKEKG